MQQVMKNILVSVFAVIPALSVQAQTYQPGKYQIDPAHSKVGFEIAHLVIATVEGRFTKFDGTIDLAEKFTNTKITATVDAASIDTGVQARDDHLKSKDFFDVAKHPQMSFVSSSITGDAKDFKLSGKLTIHGVTRDVVFTGNYLGIVKDGFGNEKAVFKAGAVINRKDFGLTWSKMVEAGPMVGDEVKIDLRIQAGRPIAKK